MECIFDWTNKQNYWKIYWTNFTWTIFKIKYIFYALSFFKFKSVEKIKLNLSNKRIIITVCLYEKWSFKIPFWKVS